MKKTEIKEKPQNQKKTNCFDLFPFSNIQSEPQGHWYYEPHYAFITLSEL